MKSIKYFTQFLSILVLFLFFKILGLKNASYISSKIISFVGPFFRSKDIIKSNILKALPNLHKNEIENISNKMWENYGKILAEYIFIKKFRESKVENNIEVTGQEILKKIKESR